MSEQEEQLRERQPLDAGFSMILHVMTLDKALSDGAFRLYALLLKYARQAGGAWPGVARLAQDLGKGARTIKRDLAELETRKLITRERRYGRSSVTWIEDVNAVYAEGAKNGPIEQPFDGAKNGPIDGAKNGPTEKEAGKKKHTTATVHRRTKLTDEQQTALDLLLTVPRMDAAPARWVVMRCNLDDVPGWVEEGRRAPADIASALVIRRLMDGDPPPTPREKPPDPSEDRRRFLSGQEEFLIKEVIDGD